MKFSFIGNASGIFTGSNGTKILCDPWIIDGIFEGAWYHYPSLKTNIKDVQCVDGIYISHIHPDHFDERHFNFPKNVAIFILDEGPNFLKKRLDHIGYKNIILIKNGETKIFKEFEITLYKPFSGHIFEESLLGNLIDSSMVLKENNVTAINFNDNTPTIEACEVLNKKFQKIDLAMLNYNAAGPYPSCFDNLSVKEKKKEHNKILERNFNHLCKIIPILKPKTILPFAGSYILGGKNFYKNEYLGTATQDTCAKFLKKNLKFKTNIICLNENQTFDMILKKSSEKYKKLNLAKMNSYIKKIGEHKYPYELDDMPELEKLYKDIEIASQKMKERLKNFTTKITTNVYIDIKDRSIQIFGNSNNKINLFCNLDLRLLRRILDRKSHWNNAEIGAHITFKREPNIFEPDIHTSLAFFHL